MRILHILPTLDPDRAATPAAAFAPRLAAAQASLGHTVHILTYEAPAAADRTHKALAGIPGFARVKVHRAAPEVKRRDRANAVAAAPLLSKLVADIDLIHLHEAGHPLVRLAVAAAKRRKLPLVLTPHGTLSPTFDAKDAPRDLLGLARRRLFKRTATILALGPAEKRDIELLHPTANVRVLPGGIFREDVLPLPGRGLFRSEHKELGSDPLVLFMDRLHPGKGLEVLIDAFAQVISARRDVRLVLIGQEDGAKDAILSQADRRGIDNRVHIYGPLVGKARIAALADATVFCLPSQRELFATPIVEALAASVPVVISEACNFPDVAAAQAGKVILLEPGSLARVLLETLGNPGERTAMGARGKELALTRYTWPVLAQRCMGLYQGTPERQVGANTEPPKTTTKVAA